MDSTVNKNRRRRQLQRHNRRRRDKEAVLSVITDLPTELVVGRSSSLPVVATSESGETAVTSKPQDNIVLINITSSSGQKPSSIIAHGSHVLSSEAQCHMLSGSSSRSTLSNSLLPTSLSTPKSSPSTFKSLTTAGGASYHTANRRSILPRVAAARQLDAIPNQDFKNLLINGAYLNESDESSNDVIDSESEWSNGSSSRADSSICDTTSDIHSQDGLELATEIVQDGTVWQKDTIPSNVRLPNVAIMPLLIIQEMRPEFLLDDKAKVNLNQQGGLHPNHTE